MTQTWQRDLDFAVNVAKAAGDETLRYYQKSYKQHAKADASPVTEADLAAERLIRERIHEAYPDDGILGEEHGLEPGDTLVVYSDGVVEAQTPEGDELGEERLAELGRTHGSTPVPELAKALVESVSAAYPEQTDDMTVVAARRR